LYIITLFRGTDRCRRVDTKGSDASSALMSHGGCKKGEEGVSSVWHRKGASGPLNFVPKFVVHISSGQPRLSQV